MSDKSSNNTPLIGIDLGTTNSLVSYFTDGKPVLIKNSHDSYLTPSVVGVLENGEILVGETAKELQVTRPGDCASCFKRLMGTEQNVKLGSKEISAIELSSYVLLTLKKDAESFLQQEIKEAVITVPAYFNELQRKATKIAGEMAGLDVKRIINEPTSAALTYGFMGKDEDKKFLIFDLGGGTFDVTVMELFDGVLEIVSTAGESFLGGEDFTLKLVSYVLKSEGLSFENTEHSKPKLFSRIVHQCEQAKRALGKQEKVSIQIPNEHGDLDNSKTIEITRAIFEEVTKPLITRIQRPVVKALRDARINLEDLDEIILVGGATRMYIIHDYITEKFKKDPITGYDPDYVVALGASVQAALIEDHDEVQDIVLTDVCPHTLGIEIMKTYGKREVDGHYLPIIHRNTTIPVSEEEIVHPHHPGQTKILVTVFQGEARLVKDNLKLGELEVTGIPVKTNGEHVPIHIRFSYDVNGLLEVEALIPELNKKFRTVIKNNVKGLSEEDIQKALKEMQKIKFYPRDDLENRRIIHFVERIIPEISIFHREELTSYLDHFEMALESRSPDELQSAKDALIMKLSSLGYTFDNEKE